MSARSQAESYKDADIASNPAKRRAAEHNHDSEANRNDDDDNDDEGLSDAGDFEAFHDPLAQHPPRRKGSNASTVQSFELYTPEEERAVLRKLDRGVVLPLAGLYLLSFIDRSSKFR